MSLICLNAKDRVIGGGSAYPELIPPTGKVLAEVTLIASGKIEQCEAYAAPVSKPLGPGLVALNVPLASGTTRRYG